jgi:hypothetical protein
MTKPTSGSTVRASSLVGSLVIFHIWGSWLILAPTDVGEKMFSTVCFGIFSTLGILAGEKVLRLLVELKWGKNASNTDSN